MWTSGQPDVLAAGPPPGGGARKPWGPVIAAVAAVLAVVAAGFVCWQVLATPSGADSPEEAVSELLASVAAQDPVGALEMVVPGEVAGLDDLYQAAHGRAEEEDLVGGDNITDALDVELDGLEFEVDELGDSAARVILTDGDYNVTFDPDGLSDRLDFVSDEYPDGRTWTGDVLDEVGWGFPDADWDNDRPDPYLDVVQIDGRWYVSLVGTYVDWFTGAPSDEDFEEEGARAPDYDSIGDEVEAVVAEEPEDVFENLADAIASEDAEQLLANFPADQVAALRPWARTVEDLVASELQDVDATVDDIDVDVEEDGDQVRMTVNRGSAQLSYVEEDGDSGFIAGEVTGTCVDTVDEYGYESDGCLGDEAEELGVDEFFLVLREVDGGYQIDLIATAVAYGQDIVDRMPDSLIDNALESIEDDL